MTSALSVDHHLLLLGVSFTGLESLVACQHALSKKFLRHRVNNYRLVFVIPHHGIFGQAGCGYTTTAVHKKLLS